LSKANDMAFRAPISCCYLERPVVLEGRLGCKLFERLPRGLAATPAANELERQVGSHLDALEAVVGISGGKNEGLAGVIHVGSTSGFTRLILSGFAPSPQYGIRLDLRSASPPALVKVARSKANIAVDRVRISHQLLAEAARGW
jgi:DNA-binding transcriptional LysR family regulator